jgi:hypothetical protein
MPFAAVGLLAGGLLVLPPADPARGCAVVPPAGGRVDISAESAVIAWDAATKTEHFTRRARFASTAADFGFLVPTPSVPDLAEADDTAFRTLENLTAPRVVYETRTVRQFGCESFKMSAPTDFANVGAAAPAPKAEVSVLKRQRVGQYDTVSLKADNPKHLLEWLEKNGYPARPHGRSWSSG